MVLSYWASMERARIDCTSMAICSKELGKGGMKIVGDERGNDILIAIRNDKEVAGTCGRKVVLPARTGEDARLGTIGTRSLSFSFSIHGFGF